MKRLVTGKLPEVKIEVVTEGNRDSEIERCLGVRYRKERVE
jgi:hypothetical protein